VKGRGGIAGLYRLAPWRDKGRAFVYSARMEASLTYTVNRSQGRIVPGCAWEKPEWRDAPSLVIDNHMGDAPTHKPRVHAKLLYDEEFLHVIFHVQDRYVRSVVTAAQGPVCTDSCVEFFFTPGDDIREGYFNIEANCGGTVLFMHQLARGSACRPMSDKDIAALTIFHTMPAVVEPEIREPVEWLVQYRVPYSVLSRRALVTIPAAGVVWRANLYKCADNTSHPHWLTWSPVAWPQPDFHRPEHFGTFVFGK